MDLSKLRLGVVGVACAMVMGMGKAQPMRHNRTRVRCGVCQIDVLAMIACVTLLCVIGSGVLGQELPTKSDKPRPIHPRSIKDQAQIKQIHQAWIAFAREFGGIFPTPGLINRLKDPILNREVPGRGPEDLTANTTANLYSTIIMQNYFAPQLIISPVERNPNVKVKHDYDWRAYNPVDDVYWDPRFKADLTKESHTSYAHMVIFGKRKEAHWGDDMSARFPILGNRGPKDGKLDPDSYTCGPHGHWVGNIVFNDNHVELLKTTTPERVRFDSKGEKKQDNLFAFDDGIGGVDAILTFTSEMSKDGPKIQHD